jgi:hypothetical protein
MPLPPEELFDSDDERPQIWHKNEWIGTGKEYPSGDTPGYILRARHELLCIPHPYATYTPDHRMSINDFLMTNLPPLSSALVVTRAEDAYSQLEPNTDLRCLATHPIPSESVDWLAKLDAAFGQAWVNAELAAGQCATAVSGGILLRSFKLIQSRSFIVDFKCLQQIMKNIANY